MLSLSSASVVMWCVIGPFNARACNKSLCGKPVTYIYIINNGTSYKNVESFVPNVKQVLFFNGSVVLLFCCFLKTCFPRKRLDALPEACAHAGKLIAACDSSRSRASRVTRPSASLYS